MRPGKGSCHAEDAEDAEALPDGGAARALFPPCLLRALRDSTGFFGARVSVCAGAAMSCERLWRMMPNGC